LTSSWFCLSFFQKGICSLLTSNKMLISHFKTVVNWLRFRYLNWL
jgi:hypothetical protein